MDQTAWNGTQDGKKENSFSLSPHTQMLIDVSLSDRE
jgi:hypothetical protein